LGVGGGGEEEKGSESEGAHGFAYSA
jgi:hypothetical protein